jgi:hypothetical protein
MTGGMADDAGMADGMGVSRTLKQRRASFSSGGHGQALLVNQPAIVTYPRMYIGIPTTVHLTKK